MSTPGKAGLIIGEYLLLAGRISRPQFEEAAQYQQATGAPISSFLLFQGYIDREAIPRLLSEQYRFPRIIIDEVTVEPEAVALLEYEQAKSRLAMPIRLADGALVVAMTEPTNGDFIREIEALCGRPVRAGVAAFEEIIEAYRGHYRIYGEESGEAEELGEPAEDTQAILDDLLKSFEEKPENEETPLEADVSAERMLEETVWDSPVILTVNRILKSAMEENASEIHLEPTDEGLRVRFRRDGRLRPVMEIPKVLTRPLTTRIKILANLDITERRVPQNGSFQVRLGGLEGEFLAAAMPTLAGESIVLRVPNRIDIWPELAGLGLEPDDLERLLGIVRQPFGLFLAGGPGGSGRSTTLYALIEAIKRPEIKIATVEDPVKLRLEGVSQVNVDRSIHLDYPLAIVGFLRQGPDVLMAGDPPDWHSADLLIESALAGKLALARAWGRDCVEVLIGFPVAGSGWSRMASALAGCSAQRLLRRLCPECKRPVRPDPARLENAGFPETWPTEAEFFQASGCPACRGTGFIGRTGVFEVLEITSDLRDALDKGASGRELREMAEKGGMVRLRLNAWKKAKDGLVDPEEVFRILETVP